MSHSIIGADRGTHCKILAVALAGVVTLALTGMAAHLGAADIPLAHSGTILRAGTPAMAASAVAPVLR